MKKVLIAGILVASALAAPASSAGDRKDAARAERVQAVLIPGLKAAPAQVDWHRGIQVQARGTVQPPTKLVIIACRVEAKQKRTSGLNPEITEPDWLLPVECMRVIETVRDAAALNSLWLRERRPNLANEETCAKVAMTFVPEWEESHRNWLVVKVGCPVKIVDADGKIIGWHMPECQGTLPGTDYPLRCRFDPSEI